jgi:cytochrome c-type biogenesis protein CcmH
MTLFWTISAGLTILAMAFVALPLLRKHVNGGITSDELNVTVFKQQLLELDSDLESGVLDQKRYDAARTDLEKELLTDIHPKEQPVKKMHFGWRTSTIALAISALGIALILYFYSDSPKIISYLPKLIVLAIAIVLLPLIYKLKPGRGIAAVALFVPVFAVTLYLTLGTPKIIPILAEQPQPNMQEHRQNMPSMEVLVERLSAKLEKEPENIEGWTMLGRSYLAMNEHSKAIKAFEKAMKLDDQNVALLLMYAEAVAASESNNFTGRAAPLIEKAYQLSPENPNVLWLTGILAYQSERYPLAIKHWQNLKERLSPQSTELESVNEAIGDAKSRLGLAQEEPSPPSITQAQKQTSGEKPEAVSHAIEVNISLSPQLQAKVKPDDQVFIYAKAITGPTVPLAAIKKKVNDLPITLRLDDSLAMMPRMKLSNFDQVSVGARISFSGNPTAQPGDLEGEIKPVTPGQQETVQVIINAVHP